MSSGNVKRVLVYRLGSLGDMVVALPSLHLVARTFPNAQRFLLTEFPVNVKAPASSAVLGDSGLIHGYLRYLKGTRNPFSLLSLWWRLFRFQPDLLVFLMGVLDPAVVRRNVAFFRSAGIKNFAGLPYGDLATWQFDPETGMFEREARRLARSLATLGDAALEDRKSWDLRLNEGEVAAAETRLKVFEGKSFISCSVGAKAQAKDWTLPNWRALLSRLTALQPDCGLLMIGSPDEKADCDELAELWRGPTANLCGELTPRQSAAALSRSILFIGHDSGPMHLAASVGVPCVAIFAARNLPGVWFPLGSRSEVIYHDVDCKNCRLDVCIKQQKKCILSITPDEVLAAASRLIQLEPKRQASH